MSFCQALESDDESKCGVYIHEGNNFCEKHREQYRALTREYKQASEEAIELGVAVAEIKVQSIHDVDEARASKVIVEKYIERLQSAIQGREEHHNKFFSGPDGPHQHFLDVLKKKQKKATYLLRSLKLKEDALGNRKHEARRMVRVVERTQTYERTTTTSSATHARFSYTHRQLPRCAAKSEFGWGWPCPAESSPEYHYCPAHLKEYRALRVELESATMRSSLLRDEILHGVRRLNEDPDTPPFFEGMVRRLVDAYIEALDKEASLIMKSQRRFASEPYGSPGPHNCAERRAKAIELQRKLSPRGRLHAALSIIMAGVCIYYIARCLGMHSDHCFVLGIFAGIVAGILVKGLPEI